MVEIIRGAKKGQSGGSEAANTLRSRSTARVIDVLCEGPINGLLDGAKSIYFGETPVQDPDGSFNFPNFTYRSRNGTPTQSPVPGFNTIETSVSVGVEVKKTQPVERSFSNADLSGVRVVLQFPSLSKVKDNGDVVGNSVELAIDYKNGASAYAEVLRQTVEGKCVSPYERGYRINFSGAGPHWVRVRRITPDATEVKDQNTFIWSAAVELIDAKMIYPDTAYVALEVDAESTGGQVPTRGYLIEGLRNIRYPSNYDPVTRTYSGAVWNGTFATGYTNNPAWVMYEVLTNKRWGLGHYIDASQINKFALYEIGKYCDEMVDDGYGGQEPRYTFNGIINSKVGAYEAVQAIASNFRSMSFWGSGAITFSQDAPKSSVQLVSPANVIDGNFDYSSSGIKDRYTVAYVTWNDPEDFYRPAVEVYEDPEGIRKYGWRKTELLAVGCTSRGQARRMGKWAVKTSLYEREFIQYRASYDHVKCRPGDIITVADPVVAGIRNGGRITKVETLTASHRITLDAEAQIFGDGDAITLVAANGTLQTRPLITEAGGQLVVETASKFSFTPRVGSMYLIGSGTVQPRKWRVLTVREDEPNIFEITAIEYYDSKFSAVEQDMFFTKENFSVIPSGKPKPPTDPVWSENLYRENNTVRARLTVSWTPPRNPLTPEAQDPRVTGYYITHRGPGGAFQPLGRVDAASLDLDDAKVGSNTFRVFSETANGLRSATALEFTIAVKGKSAPPDDVTGLVASPELQAIKLSWNPVDDIDLVGYDVREGSAWGSATPISVRMKGTQIVIPVNDTKPHTYLVRAIDDTGNYSVNAATVTATVAAPASVTAFSGQQDGERVQLQWAAVPGIDVEYEIRVGLSWDLGQRLTRVSGTSTSFLYPSATSAIFWIKSRSKLGLYSDTPRFVQLSLDNPAYRNLIYTASIQDTNFPGNKIDMAVNPDTQSLETTANPVGTSYDLYGDYIYNIALASSLRARNWLDIRPGLVGAASIAWTDATFTWGSDQAGQSYWQGDGGNDSGARFDALLSYETAFTTQDVEAWDLNSAAGLTGTIAGAAPLTNVGTAYATLLERPGLSVTPGTTQLSYAVTARTNFTYLFRVRFNTPNGDAGAVLFELANGTGTNWIKISKLSGGTYDACTFRCTDHLGRVQDVTIPVGSRRDYFSIGLSQSGSKRIFAVHSWRTGKTGFHELDVSAITTLTRLHFYDA